MNGSRMGQVFINTDRSKYKRDQKILLKISGHQQRWLRPLLWTILIPPALLVVADERLKYG